MQSIEIGAPCVGVASGEMAEALFRDLGRFGRNPRARRGEVVADGWACDHCRLASSLPVASARGAAVGGTRPIRGLAPRPRPRSPRRRRPQQRLALDGLTVAQLVL